MMVEYIGKICPYCKTPFTSGDDVVICSACEMPHHKDCWVANQGCTTFGCMGTIQTASNSPTTVTSTTMQYEDASKLQAFIYCSRCGAKNSAADSFCSKCGTKLQPTPAQSAQPHFTPAQPNFTPAQPHFTPAQPHSSSTTLYDYSRRSQESIDSESAFYIGPQQEYYLSAFKELKSCNKKTSWNWCAFLFTPYWLFYRKLYTYAAAVLSGTVLLSLLGWVGFFLTLGGYIAFGILGNNTYMQHIESVTQQGKVMLPVYKQRHIATMGGVNSVAAALAAAGYFIWIVIMNLI